MRQIVLTLTVLIGVSGMFVSCRQEAQWQPLFGNDFSQADYDPEAWSITDGVLEAVQDEAIWSTSEYENFELDLEFKNDENSNSGVVVYCTDKQDWIPNSVEIQIADDYGSAFAEAKAYSKCGAVYGHLGASEQNVVKKAGEWNHMNIKCKGQHITVAMNGKVITEMDMSRWTSGTVNPDGSEIPSWLPKPFAELPTKGYIGFQGKHGESLIWYRNIKIRGI